jgi:hypothetical protein
MRTTRWRRTASASAGTRAGSYDHRQAGLGQRLDVPQDRPLADLELSGQLLTGHPPAVLDEQQHQQ